MTEVNQVERVVPEQNGGERDLTGDLRAVGIVVGECDASVLSLSPFVDEPTETRFLPVFLSATV